MIKVKIALAQFNPVVGNICGNVRRMEELILRAKSKGAELVVFSELSVTGYPPKDLLRKSGFVADSTAAVESLGRSCRGVAALVGFVRPTPQQEGRALQNAAALLADGEVKHVHVKTLLPTYDVFDETRYFQPGTQIEPVEIAGRRVGISICEDLWDAESLGRQLYGGDPIGRLADAGAEIIVNMAASPYEQNKARRREELFARRADDANAPIVFVNQVGGNDELIFDGASCLTMPGEGVVSRAGSFGEDLLVVESDSANGRCEPLGDKLPGLWEALKLGLRDYVKKCGFGSVVLGLSGGIDSSVVAALAADAIGSENVHTLAMPGRYSSPQSLQDARTLAENLGVNFEVVSIDDVHQSYEQGAGWIFNAEGAQTAQENIQARIRGNMVMAAANAFGYLALATGNKSELSVGYCTLYGDMAGAVSPIGDVLKTTVYELAGWLNRQAGGQRIPERIISRPPTAELKPQQKDEDKLGPYERLDEILKRYVEKDQTAADIIAEGFSNDEVTKVTQMVDSAEFKRRQAPLVLKVSQRAFGSGRRMPIAQRYRREEG